MSRGIQIQVLVKQFHCKDEGLNKYKQVKEG